MSDLRADCDWHDGTLFLVLPEDPERIAVRLFPSRQAPSRIYVPDGEVIKLRQQLADVIESVGRLDGRCAKLRKQSERLFDKTLELATENSKLRELCKLCEREAENAKLRELVCHMHECMSNVDADGNHECFVCEYENAEGKCDFERLMRELGIEVD